jgi:hypothetical protein
MAGGIARTATATGLDATEVARELLTKLDGSELQLVLVFADWRIDPQVLAKLMHEKLPAPVVGCTTIGVIGSGAQPTAAALGLYGDRIRAGIGVATELPRSAFARSRDAMQAAAAALDTSVEALDSSRYVALTLCDGTSAYVEPFCVGSAATAPQIRVVGGCAAADLNGQERARVWANGEVHADAGVVVLLETSVRFEAVTSQHMIATDVKTVVTAASGRVIEELDGHPAVPRLRQLLGQLGGTLDESKPSEYSFARFVDDVPYLRSMLRIADGRIELACGVAPGQVLRLMRPGDLIGGTRDELAGVRERLGGEIAAFVAFSCIGRHWEAASRGVERPLAATYAMYPTVGFQSYGEQTGMLLVNHTLTGLAIGVPPR